MVGDGIDQDCDGVDGVSGECSLLKRKTAMAIVHHPLACGWYL